MFRRSRFLTLAGGVILGYLTAGDKLNIFPTAEAESPAPSTQTAKKIVEHNRQVSARLRKAGERFNPKSGERFQVEAATLIAFSQAKAGKDDAEDADKSPLDGIA